MGISFVIECDRCRFVSDEMSTSELTGGSAARTRRFAKRSGWTRDGKSKCDYCPECSRSKTGLPPLARPDRDEHPLDGFHGVAMEEW